jgi:hypothetical protein
MQERDHIINTQTEHPFTKTQRMFNMKESNSTGSCISCSNTGKGPVAGPKAQMAPRSRSLEIPDLSELIETMKEEPTQAPGSDGSLIENATPKDYTYNSYSDWRAPSYNQWTRIHDDNCNEENRLRIGSKPMKYYVNQYNSPQVAPFSTFTIVGGQKTFDVRNEYERAIPTRLNPVAEVSVLPYNTTPFLGAANEDRTYTETASNLRWGSDLKTLKSQNGTTEVDFNRWAPNVSAHTVQNAGQFGTGAKLQAPIGPEGYYEYDDQNNVIFMNSAIPYFGISSRNLLHNIVDLSGC